MKDDTKEMETKTETKIIGVGYNNICEKQIGIATYG